MKFETKALIVVLIMMFSVGPVSYFLQGSAPQAINVDDSFGSNETKKPYYEFPANITGKIMDIQPYISYAGVSLQNNKKLVESIIGMLNYSSNYSVDVALNPNGNGYLYRIAVVLKNVSDADYVGFRMKYNLIGFFSDESGPYMMALIELPENFTAGNNTVYVTSNVTVQALINYASNKINESVVVNCPSVKTSLNYNLTMISSSCLDEDKGYVLGLSFLDYIMNSEEKETNISATVERVVQHVLEYEFDFGNEFNSTELSAALNGSVEVIPATNESKGMIIVNASADSASPVKDSMKQYAVFLKDEYREGVVTLPDALVFDSKYYNVLMEGINAKLLKDAVENETSDFSVSATVIFNEIVDMRLQEI